MAQGGIALLLTELTPHRRRTAGWWNSKQLQCLLWGLVDARGDGLFHTLYVCVLLPADACASRVVLRR